MATDKGQLATTNILLFLILIALVGGGSAVTGLFQIGLWAIGIIIVLFIAYHVIRFGLAVVYEFGKGLYEFGKGLVALVIVLYLTASRTLCALVALVRIFLVEKRRPNPEDGDAFRAWDSLTTLLLWIALLPVIPFYASWRSLRLVRAEEGGLGDKILTGLVYGLMVLILTVFWLIGWLIAYNSIVR